MPQLPIFEITKQSYLSSFKYLPYILKKCWLLIIICSIFTVGAQFIYLIPFTLNDILGREQTGFHQLKLLRWGMTAFFLFATFSLYWLGFALVVIWHQKLIINQEPKTHFYLGVNKTTFKYLCYAISIGVLALLPLFIVGYLEETDQLSSSFYAMGPKQLITIFLYLTVLLLYLFIYSRLGLSLPALSVGKPANFRHVFALSSGHTLSLMAILFMVSVPLFLLTLYDEVIPDLVVTFLLTTLYENPLFDALALIAYLGTAILMYIVCIMPFVSGLSHSYMALTETEHHEEPQAT